MHEPHRCPGAGGDRPSRSLPWFPTYASVLETWGGCCHSLGAHHTLGRALGLHLSTSPTPGPPAQSALLALPSRTQTSCARGCSEGLADGSPMRPSSPHQAHTALPPHHRHSSADSGPAHGLFPQLCCPTVPCSTASCLSLQVQPCSIPIPPPHLPSSAFVQCFMLAWFWQGH